MIKPNSIMISARGGQYLVSHVRTRSAKRGEITEPLYRLRKIAKISVWGNGEFTEQELTALGLRLMEGGASEPQNSGEKKADIFRITILNKKRKQKKCIDTKNESVKFRAEGR